MSWGAPGVGGMREESHTPGWTLRGAGRARVGRDEPLAHGCSVGCLRVGARVSKWRPFLAFTTLFPRTQTHAQSDACKCHYEM